MTQPLPEPVDMRRHANKLVLALEPECAGLHCRQMTDKNVASFCGQSISKIIAMQYMIVDIGGGTVDIAIHDHKSTANTIHSVLPPTGNEWGGTKVNAAFSHILEEIVGDPQFQRFCSHRAGNRAIINRLLYQEFEDLKKSFGDNCDNNESESDDNEDDNNDSHIRLPQTFTEFYTEKKIKEGSQALGIEYDDDGDDILVLTSSKMKELFAPIIQKIIDCVVSALKGSPISIDTVYLVGGFGGCQYIYQKLSDILSKRHHEINLLVPRDHKLAVSRGAVTFGQNSSLIGSRVSDAYYGLQATKKYDSKVHNYTRRKYSLERNYFVCYNVFDVFIQRNDPVQVADTFKNIYTPNKADSGIVTFDIYKSTANNVLYTKDIKGQPLPEVTKIGKVTLLTPAHDLPLNERLIEVTFHIGRTELQLSAIYLPTNQEVVASVDFLV